MTSAPVSSLTWQVLSGEEGLALLDPGGQIFYHVRIINYQISYHACADHQNNQISYRLCSDHQNHQISYDMTILSYQNNQISMKLSISINQYQ